jgi:hypothetical protein
VILAAGRGSRFGGLKQLAPLGPGGETLLDYSLHDARRAGFGPVVFIIRRAFAEEFRQRVGARLPRGVEAHYVFQELDELPAGFTPPPGRGKPWGTAHAVWCARAALDRPFAVINADDFYGADSFQKLAQFLAAADPPSAHWAMAGFRLGRTLSEHGAVSRGICRVDAAGLLATIDEQTALEADPATGGARAKRTDGGWTQFPAATIVSMNCWAFTPALFPLLETELEKFLRARGGEAQSECYLPAAVGALVDSGQAQVRVLPTAAQWFGLTHRDDQPRVQAALKALHDAGLYD